MENIYISSNIEFENLNNSIKLSMKKSAGHMIQLGYLLRKMMESRLWESYYTDFDSYLREDLGMDYTMANRFINANKRFSVSGNSENIDPAYEGYSQSALIEMLALPEESMGKVSEKNTVREIREIAKAEKEKRGPSDEDVMCFYEEFAKEYDMNRSTLKENLINLYGKRYTYHGGGILDFKCSPRGIQIGESEEVTWAQLVKRINSLCPFREEEKPISMEEYTGQQAEDVMEGQIHITDYPEVIPDDVVIDVECRETEGGNEFATSQFSEKLLSPYGLEESVCPPDSLIATAGCGNKHDCFACGQTGCEIRKEERYCVEAPMGNPFPCDTIIRTNNPESGMLEGCQFINQELAYHRAGDGEAVPCCKGCDRQECMFRCDRAKKVGQADENPMDEEINELEEIRSILGREKKLLQDYLEAGGLPERTVFRQKTIVGALAAMLCDLEAEHDKGQQPDFPVLKNNDTRKKWLMDYKSWGLWYQDEKIDVRYYKFDFPDGSRIIVAEHPQRNSWIGNVARDYKYYHLVRQGEKFCHHTTSETDLVEFLKQMKNCNIKD